MEVRPESKIFGSLQNVNMRPAERQDLMNKGLGFRV